MKSMNKLDLVAIIAATEKLPVDMVSCVVDRLTQEIEAAVMCGGVEVKISGFGTFQPKRRPAKTKLDENAQYAVDLPPMRSMGFKFAKSAEVPDGQPQYRLGARRAEYARRIKDADGYIDNAADFFGCYPRTAIPPCGGERPDYRMHMWRCRIPESDVTAHRLIVRASFAGILDRECPACLICVGHF